MSIKIKTKEINGSIELAKKQRIFPGYNDTDDDSQHILPNPKTGSCTRQYSILYNTNYATVATDESVLQGLVNLARGILGGVASNGASPATIINGIENANETLQDEIKTITATEPIEIILPVQICVDEEVEKSMESKKKRGGNLDVNERNIVPEKNEHCFNISLEITGQWLLTDADKDDQEESAAITLYLNADGPRDTKRFKHARGVSRPVDFPIRSDEPFLVELKEVKHSEDFTVYGKVSTTVTTDGRYVVINSASVIRVDSIQLIIKEVTCG